MYDDLYNPILSYAIGGTYGIISQAGEALVVVDNIENTIKYYDKEFQLIKQLNQIRAGESGVYYNENSTPIYGCIRLL